MREILNRVLKDDGRELKIEPYDARWRATVTIYGSGGTDKVVSAIASTPDMALDELAVKLTGERL